jgi:hypothetical protein
MRNPDVSPVRLEVIIVLFTIIITYKTIPRCFIIYAQPGRNIFITILKKLHYKILHTIEITFINVLKML